MNNVIYLASARQKCPCGHLLAPPAAERKRISQRTGQPAPVTRCDGCGSAILRHPEPAPEPCVLCGADTPLHDGDIDPCCEHCAKALSWADEDAPRAMSLEELLEGYIPRT